jgi:chemotaxis protein MotB
VKAKFFWMNAGGGDDAQSTWALPFADLMSLLLAVFVMIAAMSELHKGRRFDIVGSAVRGSFGFAAPDSLSPGPNGSARRVSLIERLEQAGLSLPAGARPAATDQDLADCCEVVTGSDRVVIQLAGAVVFERFGAGLSPRGQHAIARIAEFLADGQARLEIRGHAGDGQLPGGTTFRDPVDLSYARARAVSDGLTRAGVSPLRVYITACGDQDPVVLSPEAAGTGVNRRVEIIVHAAKAAGTYS